MADDWIKWTCGLLDKPEVLRMSVALGVCREVVACKLMRFWEWCDANIPRDAIDANGTAVTKMSPSRGDNCHFFDAVVSSPGFAEALAMVGWLRFTDDGIELPNFGSHNGETAKTRARNARNQKSRRSTNEQKPSPVTKMSPSRGDKTVTRVEESREESIHISGYCGSEIVVPEKMNTPEVKQAASLWIAHLQQRDPDKVPMPGSPCEQGFWAMASRMGPDNFVRAVETAVAGNWINLKDVSQPASGSVSRTGGRSQNRGLSIDEAFAKMEANGEIG